MLRVMQLVRGEVESLTWVLLESLRSLTPVSLSTRHQIPISYAHRVALGVYNL